ncbi:MAG TPA: helix-turn-helix domain-containing protein [Gaiellaceae bacterium]
MSDARLILKVDAAADYAVVHPDTIRKALQAGELHGLQKRAGCSWRIRMACLDAWLSGEKCAHQLERAA